MDDDKMDSDVDVDPCAIPPHASPHPTYHIESTTVSLPHMEEILTSLESMCRVPPHINNLGRYSEG